MSQEPFTVGQTVIWLSRVLGTYGVDYIDEQVVTMTEAEVVRLTPKRVEIRVTSGDESRLVMVNPAHLRHADDPPVIVEAFELRKRW